MWDIPSNREFMRNRPNRDRRGIWLGRGGCALVLLLLMGGCASKRDRVEQTLASGARAPTVNDAAAEESYRLAFPDAVEIAVVGRPECSGRFAINVEGRLDIPSMQNPRVDGTTIPAVQYLIAQELDVPLENVHCRVIAHRSRTVYVRGAIDGGDRAVPYQGPESAVSFIRRCGGLQPSANFKDIHVVRSNLPLGSKPQVFAVDLEAILLRGEAKSNVLLQSFDEVYVGELPRAKLGRALPDFLKPVYRGLCGIVPGFCPHDWRQQIRDPAP